MNQKQELITERTFESRLKISKCESFGDQTCECGYCCADG
jgi:hypothetical protein